MEWLKGFLLTAAVFVPLELLLAKRPEQKLLRRGWLNDLVYWVVNGQITALGLSLVIAGAALAANWLMPAAIKGAASHQFWLLQLGEAIVLSDIGFYFAHRAFHAFPWLWKFHSIHHSIEELDWLAAARVHPFDQILTKGASLLPVFAFGFSDSVVIAYMGLYAWQSILVHSNVRLRLGPLRWVFASPEFHHWHHSKDREAFNRNFAAQLPVLDALFGTLHLPRGQAPKSYGLDEPVPTAYLSQMIYPFLPNAADAGAVAVDPPRQNAAAAERIERVEDMTANVSLRPSA